MATTDPGKFEGEPEYAPYFYDAWNNGEGDHCSFEDGTEFAEFTVEQSDVEQFPGLANVLTVMIWEDDQGFVRVVATIKD